MAATTKERNTSMYRADVMPRLLNFPVKAATKILKGTLVALDATGFLVPASTSTTLKAIGRAEETIDNTAGASGDLRCECCAGTFKWGNSAAGDLIAQADTYTLCYIVDNQTVAKTSGTGTRSVAGLVIGVDTDGVWVLTAPGLRVA